MKWLILFHLPSCIYNLFYILFLWRRRIILIKEFGNRCFKIHSKKIIDGGSSWSQIYFYFFPCLFDVPICLPNIILIIHYACYFNIEQHLIYFLAIYLTPFNHNWCQKCLVIVSCTKEMKCDFSCNAFLCNNWTKKLLTGNLPWRQIKSLTFNKWKNGFSCAILQTLFMTWSLSVVVLFTYVCK